MLIALPADYPLDLLRSAQLEFPQASWVLLSANPNFQAPGVTVLRLPPGSGPRAGVKLAGRWAIESGADLLIVIDSNTAPLSAVIGRISQAFESSAADVILDCTCEKARSSWLANSAARAAGKLAGRALDSHACRGYSTDFLKRVPFEINHDDALFDAEILLQAIHIGARIVETIGESAPAKSSGNSANSFALLRTALQFRMHCLGMLCDLKYRNLTPARYQDKTFMMYSSHSLALEQVRREKPATLLDIGCGPGFIARQCQQTGIRVCGIDAYPPLPGTMSEFHPADLERDPLPVDPFAYDCVLLLDVLEHMADPESFLLSMRNRSNASRPAPPLVIISTPNVAFAAIRWNLLLGRFNYAERGILDITHKRLFTRWSLLRAISDCGYAIEKVIPVGVPFQTVLGGRLGKMLGEITGLLARAWPTMFAFQFIVTCRPRPGVRQLLAGQPPITAAATAAAETIPLPAE